VGFFVLNAPYLLKQLKYAVGESPIVSEPILSTVPSSTCATPNRLWINSLAIEAPLVYVSGTTHQVFQGGLEKGVVHFPGTALPGEYGNAYFFGHSSDYPWKRGAYKTVFALLPKIKKEDEIRVSDADGNVFVYIVHTTLVVGPKDVRVLDQHNRASRMLSLQTSYPLGTALQRFIVQAEYKDARMCDADLDKDE
jgi:LPXTG-site transpeptidase (sortase) family protein